MGLSSRSVRFLSLVLGLSATNLPARADTPDELGKFASGTGSVLYLAAGVGWPLLTDGKAGKAHSLRTLDSLGTSVLVSEGLKALFQEKRPDSNAHDSFPSGHATAAFAVATMQSAFHPKDALWWYTGAALISVSRFTLHRHTVGDVLAGAALGYGMSRLELSLPRGLVLAPFISPERKGSGLQVSLRF